MKIILWIGLITFLSIANGKEERPLVSLDDGLIKGTHKTSYDGRTYSAFEGIPYAKPPIGSLRFKDPQPPSPWSGVLEATTQYQCMQYPMFGSKVIGQEDCLYINVYVPRENIDSSESLDVLVHFHGGAYMVGSTVMAGPSKLMDRDLVYVNLNYRLGPLGFLSFGDNVIPGNYGMKDQTFALRWVKKNIGKFGGNPNSVTITGLSAGGSSTHLHYFSPISKGLFHRGIAGNGVALVPWAIRQDPYTPSKVLARNLGCPNESTEVILRCMQERSALQIQESIKQLYIDFESLLPLALFGPVIEPASETAFLSTDPYVQYKDKTVTDVPLLSTMTTGEGAIPGFLYMKRLDWLNKHLREYLPAIFEYDTYDEELEKKATEKIIEHYFDNQQLTLGNFEKFIKLGTDRLFHIGASKSVRLHASSLTSNAYLLLVGYAGPPMMPGAEKFGVAHCQDMKYCYDSPSVPEFPVPKITDEELPLKRKLLDMLVNFVKTGKPTFEGVEFEPVPKDGDLKYLFINSASDAEMTTDNSFGDIDFWTSIGLNENKINLSTNVS